jgi:hypothetical protein
LKTLFRRSALAARAPALVVLAACLGCSSSPDDSGGDAGQVSIAPLSREPTPQGVTLDSVELSLARVALVPCVADTALINAWDFPIPLFHEPAPRVIFECAVNYYCGVQLVRSPSPANDRLSDLAGYTALFRGTRSDGTPFELRSTATVSFDFHSDSALAAGKLVLGADLASWLAGVDLDGAAASDGSVLVDADHNPDALAAFDAAVEDAFALYEDTNDDGALSDDELTPVATDATATP